MQIVGPESEESVLIWPDLMEVEVVVAGFEVLANRVDDGADVALARSQFFRDPAAAVSSAPRPE